LGGSPRAHFRGQDASGQQEISSIGIFVRQETI
jgi:hypothetical protein